MGRFPVAGGRSSEFFLLQQCPLPILLVLKCQLRFVSVPCSALRLGGDGDSWADREGAADAALFSACVVAFAGMVLLPMTGCMKFLRECDKRVESDRGNPGVKNFNPYPYPFPTPTRVKGRGF